MGAKVLQSLFDDGDAVLEETDTAVAGGTEKPANVACRMVVVHDEVG